MRDDKANTFAIASLVLGLFSLAFWCLPCCCGTPIVPILGLIFGALGLKSEHRTMAIVGLVLNSVGMLLIVVNARVVGLLVGSTMVASGAGFDWAIGCGLAIGALYSAAFIVYGGVGFRTA